MTLESLIQSLQDADGPSAKLDDAIYETVYGYEKAGGSVVGGGGMLNETFWLTRAPKVVIGAQVLVGRAPMFTFSIAVARGLLEAGFLFSLEGNASDHQQGAYGKARVWCAPEYAKVGDWARIDVEARGATPALALCAAAVKCRRDMRHGT